MYDKIFHDNSLSNMSTVNKIELMYLFCYCSLNTNQFDVCWCNHCQTACLQLRTIILSYFMSFVEDLQRMRDWISKLISEGVSELEVKGRRIIECKFPCPYLLTLICYYWQSTAHKLTEVLLFWFILREH